MVKKHSRNLKAEYKRFEKYNPVYGLLWSMVSKEKDREKAMWFIDHFHKQYKRLPKIGAEIVAIMWDKKHQLDKLRK